MGTKADGFIRTTANTRYDYIPFLVNQPVKDGDSYSHTRGLFTYKDKTSNIPKDGSVSTNGQVNIGICSSSYMNDENDDIANRMLRYIPSTTGDNPKGVTLSLNQMMNHIPCVTIREYQYDSSFNQMVNFFYDLITSFKESYSEINKKKDAKDKDGKPLLTQAQKAELDKGMSSKLTEICKYAVDVVGAKNDAGKKLWKKSFNSGVSTFKISSSDDNIFRNKMMIDFPYLLYYKMQTATTTNVYEIPYLGMNSINNSDGSQGWDVGGIGFESIDSKLGISKLPIIGGLIKSVLGNINVNYMKMWDAPKGINVKEQPIKIEFNLYNDDVVTAVSNYLLINTLIANNRFIQNGIFNEPPCLYDIKIDGANRFFCCWGKFNIESVGTLRTPPTEFFNYLEKHVNPKYSGAKDALFNNKMIRIPDIYKVTCDFQPLLPQNFNNYLYSLIANTDIKKVYKPGVVMQKEGGIAELISQFVTDVKDAIVAKDKPKSEGQS